jgi:hypothetical protein
VHYLEVDSRGTVLECLPGFLLELDGEECEPMSKEGKKKKEKK